MKKVFYLDLIALVFLVLQFRVVKKSYKKLPEKIPIHIGPDGKATSWTHTSFGTAYLLCFINLFACFVFFVISLFLKEEFWIRGFNIIGLSFLFYYLQIGYIRYSIGEIKNMGQYMAIAFSVFILSFIIPEWLD